MLKRRVYQPPQRRPLGKARKGRRVSILIPLLAVLSASSVIGCHTAFARAPSFDCGAVHTPTERLICKDPALSKLDADLAAAYTRALNSPSADRAVLKAEQLAWLRDRDKRCQQADPSQPRDIVVMQLCLAEAYTARASELAAPLSGDDGVCSALGRTIRAANIGTLSSEDWLADRIAGVAGSPLRLDKLVHGYVLKTSVQGSLYCESAYLSQERQGKLQEISIPADFAPEEGSHCGADRVRLASVNGIPGLLHEWKQSGGNGEIDSIGVSLRVDGFWEKECFLRVRTQAEYHVAVGSCADSKCGNLNEFASRLAASNRGLAGAQKFPSESDLSGDQRTRYSQMLQIAVSENLATSSQVPYFGSLSAQMDARENSRCEIGFDGLGGTLFPAVVDGEILLGKIGADGFGLGAHSGGPNDAIALYRFTDGKLQAIAGFCVVAGQRTITSTAIDR